MAKQQHYHITPLGDAALLVQFGNAMDEAVNRNVHQLYRKLKKLALPYVKDVVPAYASLAVYYDVYQLLRQQKHSSAYEYVCCQLKQIINEKGLEEYQEQRLVRIPVCYAPLWAPDIKEIARAKNLLVEDVIHILISKMYTVYMIGFLPGFAYMGKVDSRIAVPRKAQPRLHIEAGAVGIAGMQTGIYPLASPGGWQIIGRTPLLLFQKEADQPVLLQPGDQVQFYSITEDEFTNY